MLRGRTRAGLSFYRSWTGSRVTVIGLLIHGNGKLGKEENEARITGLRWELIEDLDS
jgi:hypothetical protein